MRAIIFSEYGGPEVLQEAEMPQPQPESGQVRIRIQAVGVNPVEAKIRAGMMQAMWPLTFPAIPGNEVAGVIDEVGPGVTDVTIGDEVLGWTISGAYAEYALATTYARKPSSLPWDVAAALPVAGEAAQRVLNLLALQPGETVLIHGAAGAVGTLAIQLAVRLGANVIGTASAANQSYLQELGATPVVYGEGLVERVRAVAPRGIDAVLDAAGKGALPDSITLRGGTSRILTLADMNAQRYGVEFAAGTADTQSPAGLAELAQLAAVGALRVTIRAVYSLTRVQEAQRECEAGRGRGKIVLHIP